MMKESLVSAAQPALGLVQSPQCQNIFVKEEENMHNRMKQKNIALVSFYTPLALTYFKTDR